MVAKKKETIEVTKPGTAVVNIHEELKKEAAAIASRIGAPSGDKVRCTQDKFFQLPSGEKSNNPLRMVIVDFLSFNQFHDRPYVKGEEMAPACYAIGLEPKGMVPSPKSPDMQVEKGEGCDTCPNNEFGTKGKGKACANTRLLALVPDSADPDAPMWIIQVSATGIKAFDAYVATIKAQFDMPPISVVTDIYFDPGLTYGSLRFGNPSPNENLAVHYNRKAAARTRLLVEPDVSQYKPPAPVKGSAKKR